MVKIKKSKRNKKGCRCLRYGNRSSSFLHTYICKLPKIFIDATVSCKQPLPPQQKAGIINISAFKCRAPGCEFSVSRHAQRSE